MGYTTEFTGHFTITPQLTLDDYRSLEELHGMDPHTHHLPGAPDAYCQWVPTRDGRGLEWDGEEKFYCYTDWLQWLIDHVFVPKGYTLSGEVAYQGEEIGDTGRLVVENNAVQKLQAVVGIVTCPQCRHQFLPVQED